MSQFLVNILLYHDLILEIEIYVNNGLVKQMNFLE